MKFLLNEKLDIKMLKKFALMILAIVCATAFFVTLFSFNNFNFVSQKNSNDYASISISENAISSSSKFITKDSNRYLTENSLNTNKNGLAENSVYTSNSSVNSYNSLSSGDETVNGGQGFLGDGSKENPYQIASISQMREFANLVNVPQSTYASKNYVLMADIDLGGVFDNESSTWSGENWVPIGNNQSKFTGSFNGNGFTLSNLYIDGEGQGVGLFGNCAGATLSNIALSNGYVKGGAVYVASLCGIITNGNVSQIFSTVDVIGYSNIGGIVGYSNSTNFIDMVYGGNVKAINGSNAGGLIGQNVLGSVSNSFMVGSVTGFNTFGVLIGLNSGVVSNCFFDDIRKGEGISVATSPIYQNNGNANNCYGLTTTNMVTIMGQTKPLGMTDFDFTNWVCYEPQEVDGVFVHYYPQLASINTPPIGLKEVKLAVFVVKFMFNNNTNEIYKEVEVVEGDTLDRPLEPERAGYLFMNWVTASNSINVYDFNKPVTESFSIYASWEFNKKPEVVIRSNITAPVTYNPNKPVRIWVDVQHGSSNIEYEWYLNNKLTNLKGKEISIVNVNDSGIYSCKVTVKGDGNDFATRQSDNVSIIINKAIPTLVPISQKVFTYGEKATLGDIILPEGYSWNNPDYLLTVTADSGIEHGVHYTPKDINNYSYVSLTINIKIIKADYKNITHDSISVVYQEGLTLKELKLDNFFYWDNQNEELHADINGVEQYFQAIYNDQPENYNDYHLSIRVIVSKAMPIVYVAPEGNIYEDMALSDVVLVLSDSSTPGQAVLVHGQEKHIGVYTQYNWIFTPSNTRDYHSVGGSVGLIFLKIVVVGVEVTSLPSKDNGGFRAYDSLASLSDYGMVVSQVFNNKDKRALSTDKFSISCSTNEDYLLYSYTTNSVINGVSTLHDIVGSVDVHITYTYQNETFSTSFSLQVDKAIYSESQSFHPDVNIVYKKNRVIDDLQEYLNDNYTIIVDTIDFVYAGVSQYRARYNADSQNYYDKVVNVTFNVLKADYLPSEVKEHAKINVTYYKGLMLLGVKLNDNYRWAEDTQRINAGIGQSFQAFYNKDSQNYNDFSTIVFVDVAQAEISMPNTLMVNAGYVYDGSEKAIVVNESLPEGVKVSYVISSTINGQSYVKAGNSAVKAGAYVVKAFFEIDENWDNPSNYLPISSQWAGLHIYKKVITIDFPNLDLITKGAEFTLLPSVKELIAGESVSVSIKVALREDNSVVIYEGIDAVDGVLEPGRYSLIATIKSENYSIEGGTYTVNFDVYGDSISGEYGDISVTVKAPNAVMPDAELKVSEVTNVNDFYSSRISKVIGSIQVAAILDIELLTAENFVGEVSVTMTIPTALRSLENIRLVHIDDNELITELDVTRQGDIITFKVNSFSKFAFVTDAPIISPPNIKDPAPASPISLTVLALLAIGLLVLCFIGAYYLLRKK